MQENLELSAVPSSHETVLNYESALSVELCALLMPLIYTKALALAMVYISSFGLPLSCGLSL